MQPRISIITICYNAASTITRTLRSVSAQTYPNIQYLIIDGASKDNTLELVRELAPEAEIYSERDKGIYDAMNKGLDRATGDYVWYVNAGDALVSPTTVEDLVRATCTGDSLPDVLYGDTRLIDAEDHDLGLRRLRPPHQLDWRSFRASVIRPSSLSEVSRPTTIYTTASLPTSTGASVYSRKPRPQPSTPSP